MDTSNFKEVFESPKVKELTAQVAALELEVVRLRNALETFIAEHEECEDSDGWMAQMCSMEALHVADEALSTPFTPTALQADSATAWAQAHRLALELECLLLDTKDNAIVSKWWESGMAALDEYQQLKPGAKEEAAAWAKMRKETP